MRRWLPALCLIVSSFFANAAERPLSSSDIFESLTRQYGLSPTQAEKVMRALQTAQSKTRLPITGLIWTHGLTCSFFIGNGCWENLTVTFKDEETGTPITTNQLLSMNYYNGGLAASLGYKAVFIAVLGDVSVQQLNGAVFGRGVGLSFTLPHLPAGTDVQFLPGANINANLAVVSIVGGGTVGLRFPKIEFFFNNSVQKKDVRKSDTKN